MSIHLWWFFAAWSAAFLLGLGHAALAVAHDEEELDVLVVGALLELLEVGVLGRGEEGVDHLEAGDAVLGGEVDHAHLVDLLREEHLVQGPGGEGDVEFGHAGLRSWMGAAGQCSGGRG